MNFFRIISVWLIVILFSSCQNEPVQIADNTFLFKTKVYKIIDNELVEVADVNAEKIRKYQITKPQRKSLGSASLDFVKRGASVNIDALYRGNILYYKAMWDDFNDLKENYYPGTFTINFLDEFGFILHSVDIPTSELVARVNSDGDTNGFEFSGKAEMSTDISAAIKDIEVSAAVKEK